VIILTIALEFRPSIQTQTTDFTIVGLQTYTCAN